ncbi:hypothetical protein [Streptomyces hygroscopicus]|uniref:hypothetical protein n=1 Tax=Streptomyces hygroscopicus TaxID=1912 RepID=UPI00076797B1|nr:hypothetical protein [Streptomyces hygroscopicus]
MRIRAITATALLLAAAAVGCSSNSDDSSSDHKPTSAAPTTPTLDPAEARTACVDAIAEAIQDDNDPEATGDRPDECQSIAEDDWLDVYMDGMRQRNQKNRDALGGTLEDAGNG